MRIAVTGGTGFVGQALVPELARRGYDLALIGRKNIRSPAPHLNRCEAIIHLAALAHRDHVDDALLDDINRQLPLMLADAAIEKGVKRFIFVSSIAAIEGNQGELRPDMPYAPLTPFGRSKAEAERALLEHAGLEVVVLRAPLVYGPEARGNIAKLKQLARLGLPLPFGAIRNQRSLVSRQNMVDGLIHLLEAPREKVAGRIFHITDAHALSLPDLLRTVMAPDPVRLFNAPSGLVKGATRLLAGKDTADKLFGDLLVDGSSMREIGWSPTQADER